MPITLNQPEVRPTVTEARIIKATIDAEESRAVFTAAFGYKVGNVFNETYRRLYTFDTADWTALLQNVSQIRDLRDAMEVYIATNRIPGVKT